MSEDPIPQIRPYRPADQSALLSLIRELQAFERAIDPLLKPEADIGFEYIEALCAEIEKHGGAILVAEDQSQLVGYAAIFTSVPNDDDDEIAYNYALVRDLSVAASHRGKGLGKRLLAACEERARAAGAERLRIMVLSQNTGAHGLYTKFGFADRLTEMEKALE